PPLERQSNSSRVIHSQCGERLWITIGACRRRGHRTNITRTSRSRGRGEMREDEGMSDAEVPAAVPSAHSWSPGTLWPGLRIAGGFGAVAIGVLGDGPVALVITGMPALFRIPSGVLQLPRRPRSEVRALHVALRPRSRVECSPRSAGEGVRALVLSRWGMRHHQMRLEYVDDSGPEQLEVFTRMDLGVGPRDVVDAVGRLGFPTR